MNSTWIVTVLLQNAWKKKKKKEQKRSLWNADVGSVDPNIHLTFYDVLLKKKLMILFYV